MDSDEEMMYFDDQDVSDYDERLSRSAMELDESDMLFGSNDWQNSSPRLLMDQTGAALSIDRSLELKTASTDRLEELSKGPRTANESGKVKSGQPTSHVQEAANTTLPRDSAISKIESIFESMVDVLNSKKGVLTLRLKSRSRNQTPQSSASQLIQYPAKSARDAWKFGMLKCAYFQHPCYH